MSYKYRKHIRKIQLRHLFFGTAAALIYNKISERGKTGAEFLRHGRVCRVPAEGDSSTRIVARKVRGTGKTAVPSRSTQRPHTSLPVPSRRGFGKAAPTTRRQAPRGARPRSRDQNGTRRVPRRAERAPTPVKQTVTPLPEAAHHIRRSPTPRGGTPHTPRRPKQSRAIGPDGLNTRI